MNKVSLTFVKCWLVALTIISALWMVGSPVAHAALAMDSTRYIFKGDAESLSVTVTNDAKKAFGGQSWIDNIVEKDTRPTFVVTPSFFRMKPASKQVMRVILASDNLPQDKESVYWLNLQDIPPAMEGSGLAIAMRTKVKLFYRPKALLEGRNKAEEGIVVDKKNNSTVLINKTPYIFAVSSLLDSKGHVLKTNDYTSKKLLMFMPGDEVSVQDLPVAQVGSVNDFGAEQIYTIHNMMPVLLKNSLVGS